MVETPCESNTNTVVDKHILTENFVLWYYYADDEGYTINSSQKKLSKKLKLFMEYFNQKYLS